MKQINQKKLPEDRPVRVEIIRSSRRTMVLEVTRDGRVLVRVPYRMPEARIRAFVEEKKEWLEYQLARAGERQKRLSQVGTISQEQRRAGMEAAWTRISERAAYYAEIIGVTYGKITIREQKSRWGSCSSRGNLNFNWKLVLAPPEVLDYVVVHELCHRLQMNHSPEFWNEVERVLPDYQKRRKWLKENGWLLDSAYHAEYNRFYEAESTRYLP